eukprot:scaffold2703_cov129-Isochrysis_galbana.AAC.5
MTSLFPRPSLYRFPRRVNYHIRGPKWMYGGGPRHGVGRCGLPFTRGRGGPGWLELVRAGPLSPQPLVGLPLCDPPMEIIGGVWQKQSGIEPQRRTSRRKTLRQFFFAVRAERGFVFT